MIRIDGSDGEGGGQVLRTAPALSLATETPFRIENIRAKRRKPGLLRQHLAAVRAATAVGGARIEGDSLGSGGSCRTLAVTQPSQTNAAIVRLFTGATIDVTPEGREAVRVDVQR